MTEELNQTKVLSIAGANDPNANLTFAQKEDAEKKTIKLYYYMWLSRLFIFFAIVSLSVFMSSSLALFKLAPQVFVEPFLVISQDESQDLVRSEAIVPKMPSKSKLIETFMRQYIILRNTIIPDVIEMETRWAPGGMINFYSSNQMYEEFREENADIIQSAGNSGLNRSVIIDKISQIGGNRSPIWRADFRTFDLTRSNTDNQTNALKLVTRYWTASINASFYPERIFLARRLMNPLGFTVIDYSQAQVNVF